VDYDMLASPMELKHRPFMDTTRELGAIEVIPKLFLSFQQNLYRLAIAA
jgi:hypothetical protein